jgi:hypothetical protein
LYKERWDWAHLSKYRYLPWSLEFIELYIDKWEWIYSCESWKRRRYRFVTQWFDEATKNKKQELTPYLDNLIARNLESKDALLTFNKNK